MRSTYWFVAALIGLTSCGSNNDPTVKTNLFGSSACKKSASSKQSMARIRTLMVIDGEAGLEGLRCVAWERIGEVGMRLDLYNFDSACGAIWSGDGAMGADGTLAVHVRNPSCQIAACGSCMYDWSFDFQLSIPTDQAVPVTVAIDACEGQQATKYITGSIGPEAKGIRCALANYGALTWQAAALGTCGKAGMPCTGSSLCGSGSFTSTGTCAEGLVCDSSAAVNEPVCFVPCTTAADCPRADVYSCEAGLCRPTGLAL